MKTAPVKAGKIQDLIATLKEYAPFPLIKIIGGELIYIFKPPISFAEGYKAFPANITLGVNERITVQVGNINTSSGLIESANDWFFFTDRYLTFSAETLGGNPGGVWFINFNPPTVSIKSSKYLATNVTISLTSPPVATDLIQDTIIRIHIADTWVVKNLWWPEDKSYHIGGDNFSLFYSRPSWFIAALLGGFGKLSGKILVDPYYVDILVKVKPFHSAKIQALPPSKLAPNDIVSIPVLVENQGNYNDTFNFRIRSETGYPLTLTNNGTITLRPGEQGQAFVGVAVPANFLDTGTLHSIFIDTYSAEEPNTSIASQRIFVETQGLYFSEENSMYTIGFGLLFLIGVVLFLVWRRKIPGKTSKKPEKPWRLPEEQAHLAELKRTDKNAYEQERILMEDEYKSALLTYKNDQKQFKVKPIKEKAKKTDSSIFKKMITPLQNAVKPKKKQKEKTKKKPVPLLKKSEKKPKEKIVKPLVPFEDSSKQKILAKIKREQDKQLRKLQ
jgi:hypothetical protein